MLGLFWINAALLVVGIQFCVGYKINITKLETCQDVPYGDEWPVELTSVQYDYVDNFCDTIHGTYLVRTIDTRPHELVISVFRCPTGSKGDCDQNQKDYIERLHCDRFTGDQSGPWYMFSSSMSGSKCGESLGEFSLDTAILKPQYLSNYVDDNAAMSNYRLRMLFHKKGESMDDLHVRGCISIVYDLFF